MAGLHWTIDSTMEELAASLDAAFLPGLGLSFRAQHEYMLEHYLVTYVFPALRFSVRFYSR